MACFVNRVPLSGENRESELHEFQTGDCVGLAIDTVLEGQVTYYEVAARVEYAGYPGPNGRRSKMPQMSSTKSTLLP
jgi:hypothetical protein